MYLFKYYSDLEGERRKIGDQIPSQRVGLRGVDRIQIPTDLYLKAYLVLYFIFICEIEKGKIYKATDPGNF